MGGVIIEENDDQIMEEVQLFNDMDAKTRRLLRVYIKLGWKKLNDYYGKLTSTAYVAAVVFHPCKKWRALERLWNQLPSRQTSEWKRTYSRSLTTIWEEKYKNKAHEADSNAVPAAGTSSALDYIERRLAFSRPLTTGNPDSQGRQSTRQQQSAAMSPQDEFDQYLSEAAVDNIAYKADPIGWWRDVGVMRFPRLSYMAVDFLTIASAETERDFSSCGRMVTPLRSRLRRHVVAMAQCLRSWSKAGIYQPTLLPLSLLEGDNWRQVLQLVGRITVDRDNEE
jgi:hypothetical protein